MTVGAFWRLANMWLFKDFTSEKMTIIWHLIWRQGPFLQSIRSGDQICRQTWSDKKRKRMKKKIQRQLRANTFKGITKRGVHSKGAFQHFWPSIPLDNSTGTSRAAPRTSSSSRRTFTLKAQYLSFYLFAR